MSVHFDPYHKWLGIPPAEQPPNHYRMLGVPAFEPDADVIANASDRVMAHLRTFQSGPYSAESQRLLNEVAAARVCLLNPAKKSGYDRQLLAAQPPTAPPAASIPPPQSVARSAAPLRVATPISAVAPQPASAPVAEAPDFDFGDESLSSRRSRAHKRKQSSSGGAIGLLVVLVAGAGIALVAWRSLSTQPVISTQKTDDSRKKIVEPISKPATDKPKPPPPKNSNPIDAPAIDSSTAELFGKVTTAIRQGQVERSEALGGSGGSAFEDLPKPGALVVGLDLSFIPYSSGDLIVRSVRPIFLTSGGAIAYGHVHGAAATVVRELAKPGYAIGGITLRYGMRVDGLSVTYMRITADGLNPDDAYVSKWLGGKRGGGPTSLAGDGSPVIGIFGGVGEEPDRLGLILAKLDRESQPRQPDDPDLAESMPDLDESEGMKDRPDPREVNLPEGLPFAHRPTANRKPVPSDKERAAALKLIHELFDKKFADAKAPAKKFELAAELFKQGSETHDDLAARYALLDEARRLATEACVPQGIMDAVSAMAADFEIDDVEMTVAGFEAAAKTSTDTPQKKQLADKSLLLIDEAVRRERYDAARRLSVVSRSAASKVGDAAMISAAGARAKLLKEQLAAYQVAADSLEAVAVTPDDPEANFLAGRFRTLVEEKWGAGLPMLAKGSNAAYQKVSLLELEHESTSEALAAIGDAWHDLPEDDPFFERLCRSRAVHWYRLAVGEATGLAKARIEKRIEELSAK